jgi:NitT/TauT family transport system permease protein
LAAFVVLWQTAISVGGISDFVLPAPGQVAMALLKQLPRLAAATLHTAMISVIGLSAATLAGTLTAFAFSQSSLVRTTFYPYAILLQTVPIIAVAPIIIILFGRGIHSVAMVSLIISTFPIITSTTTGLLQTDRNLLALFQLHSATWWQTLWKLRLPSALPYLISGIRIASGTAVVGAIVGEFFVGSSQPGLGNLIQKQSASLQLPELYSTVFAAALLGVCFFSLISLSGEFVLRRWFGTSLSGQR